MEKDPTYIKRSLVLYNFAMWDFSGEVWDLTKLNSIVVAYYLKEYKKFRIFHSHTVFWGLILAILKACSNADCKGLQVTGVLGGSEQPLDWVSWSVLKIPFESSSLETLLLLEGFNVSKQITASKQSSNPSLLRTLAMCALSALEKIYKRPQKCYIEKL